MAETRDSPARSLFPKLSKGERGPSEFGKWMKANWTALLMLSFIFLLALFVRSYFAYDTSVNNGYLVSGGSDSYYWDRIINYHVETGDSLYFDPMLNYPFGGINPRPPVYSMAIAIPAVLSQGLFGSIDDATGFMIVWSTAFWGALTVVPVYFLGKETFGRRAGMVAAFFFSIMPAHVQRSVLSNADHDALILFFIVLIFYFLLKSVKTQEHRRWVTKWKDRSSIRSGLKDYFANSRAPILYALLAGIAYGVLMMTWVGFAYVTVLILVYYIVQLLFNKFKNQDSTSVTILMLFAFGIGYIIALPYYINYYDSFMEIRFLVPVYLTIGAMAFGGMFVITRDYPWTLSLPAIGGVLSVGVLSVLILYPEMGEAIITGAGYFQASKLYSTIAEARAPIFSELALSFGVVTFFMSLIGLVWAVVKIPKRATTEYMFIVVWLAASIFMAISAGRFMFNAAPAFALSAGWVLVMIVDALDFESVRKTMMGAGGSFLTVFRKSVKIRHIVGVLFLAFLVVLPNVWYSVDAGMPSEVKRMYDKQVYSTLPSFMQQDNYDAINGTYWYFGAFGYSLPLPTYYFPAAWDWFSEQDTEVVPASSKPAYAAWWDYGFEAIDVGEHPAVADNFQNGYQMTGNIILAQSEDEAIALFAYRLIEAGLSKGGDMEAGIMTLLESYGISSERMSEIRFGSGQALIDEVLADPDMYGPMSSDLDVENARITVGRVELSKIGTDLLVALYDDLCTFTGWEIRYFNVDSRMFPLSGSSTGIFYAPAKLADRRFAEGSSIPYDFFRIVAVDSSGVQHELEDLTYNMNIVSYEVVYAEMFYNSMFYAAMCGFSGSDIGLEDTGLPGYSGDIQSETPMPGWNMTHFRMVYRTAYYNPYPAAEIPYHSDATIAISYDEALEISEKIANGEMDGYVYAPASAYQSGTVFLEYYHGAYVNGTVTTDEEYPVEGLVVTILDEYGIPHHVTTTNSEGEYSLLAPFGNVTVVISQGSYMTTSLIGTNEIDYIQFDVTDDQAMRVKQDLNGDGILDYIITKDFVMTSTPVSGDIFWDVDREGNYTVGTDELIPDVTVVAIDTVSGRAYTFDASEGTYEGTLPPGQYDFTAIVFGKNLTNAAMANVTTGSDFTLNLPIMPGGVAGYASYVNGEPAAGVELVLSDVASDMQFVTVTDESGKYLFDRVLEAKFRLQTTEPGLIVFNEKFSVTTSPEARNITVCDKVSISYRATVDGAAAAYASYLVSDDYDAFEYLTGSADKYGRIKLDLPVGHFSLYVTYNSGEVTYAGSIAIGASISYTGTLALAQSYRIVGGLLSPSESVVKNCYVTFTSENGARIPVQSDKYGGLEIWLPAGTYATTAYSLSQDGIYSSSITVSSDIVGTSFKMSSAIAISGTLYMDSNSDGAVSLSEAGSGGLMISTDSFGRTHYWRAYADGTFSIMIQKGIKTVLTSGNDGYSSWSSSILFGSDVSDTSLIMVPDKVVITGKVTMGSIGIRAVDILFDPTSTSLSPVTVVSGTNGYFSVAIDPSEYTVIIDQESSIVEGQWYQYESDIEILPGSASITMNLPVITRVEVSGDILGASSDLRVSFTGPETKEQSLDLFSYSMLLIPGTYDVYASGISGSSSYAQMLSFDVSIDSRVCDIHLELANKLSGTITLESSTVTKPISITATSLFGVQISDKSSSSGVYSLTLPQGTYVVSYLMESTLADASGTRYIEYYDESIVEMSSSDVVESPMLDMRFDNTTFSGQVVNEYGTPVTAFVQLTPNGDYGIATSFATSSSGSFSANVQPGDYTLYVTRSTDKRVSISYLHIERNTPVEQTVALSVGVYLKGTLMVAGSASQETVMISNGETQINLAPASDGYFNTLVPNDNYTVSSSASRVEGGMTVSYGLSKDVVMDKSDVYVNLALVRDTERSVVGSWNSTVLKTVAFGGVVSYVIALENTGNVADTYILSYSGSDFEVAFEPAQVYADYGTYGDMVYVIAKITIGDSLEAGNNTLTVTAKSASQSSIRSDINMIVNVLPSNSVMIESANTGAPVDGNSTTTTFVVTNTGNVADEFTLGITNSEPLVGSGWIAEIVDVETGDEVTSVALEAFEEAEFKVIFTSIRVTPDPKVGAVVLAVSTVNDGIEAQGTVAVKLPDLVVGAGDLEVERDDVSYVYDASRLYLDVLLAAMLAALVAMFFIMRRRKGLGRSSEKGGKK